MKRISWQKLDKNIQRSIDCIIKAGKRQGTPVFIIGGTVRDILLRKKNLDLDCVVEGDAVALAQAVARMTRGELKVHKRFTTATVKTKDGVSLDFAMAREEHYPQPGALPVVRKGSIYTDLRRRDFTINAMAVALYGDQSESVLDMCGGVDDLRQKRIRVLHDRSFLDDPTRMIRGIRFEQRFQFSIEPCTMKLFKSALRLNAFASVKRSRLFTEFRKVLKEEDVVRCVSRLHSLGCLKVLFQNAPLSVSVLKRIEETRACLPQNLELGDADWTLIRLLALISKMTGGQRDNIFQEIPLSRREKILLLNGRKTQQLIQQLSVKKMQSSEIYAILKPLAVENIVFIRLLTSVKIVRERIDFYLTDLRFLMLEISGDDVKEITGGPSSQEVGRVLKRLLWQRLNGHYITRASQLDYVRRWSAGVKEISRGTNAKGQ